MVQILAESNPVWQAQIDQQLPHSYVDLSNMANVVTYLDCLARHDGVVGIENPEESKILQHVKEVWSPKDDTLLCGLYVHPHVFVPSQDQLYGDMYDLYYLKEYPEAEVEHTILHAYSS